MTGRAPLLGWLGILRLGLVQASLGSIVVLTTSTLNRVMVVELALPAMLPGLLVGLHYAVQVTRPRWGYGADRSRRRTPWIVGGMAVLALGAVGAALATAWMASQPLAGTLLALVAFVLVGCGVGAAGTALLTLLAAGVGDARRAPAATIVWVMMIAGFVVAATVAGAHLDPFSMTRLVTVTSLVAALAFAVSLVALRGLEPARSSGPPASRPSGPEPASGGFARALAEVWAEPTARRFTIFVFVSMLAYSAQDLILEPFAGLAFDMTPGETTRLAGVQHGGVLAGMLLVGLAGAGRRRARIGSLRAWTIGGCAASAAALLALAAAGWSAGQPAGAAWPLRANVFLLGLANGVFAVAAIGSMMELAGRGRGRREGVRMGLWGAAQAVAFGLGGLLGTLGIDLLRLLGAAPTLAYAAVFAAEALLFLLAALLGARLGETALGARPIEPVAERRQLARLGGH